MKLEVPYKGLRLSTDIERNPIKKPLGRLGKTWAVMARLGASWMGRHGRGRHAPVFRWPSARSNNV